MAIGNGESIRFWHDLWIGNETLAARFNRIYHLDSDPNGSIASKVIKGAWHLNWNRDIVGGRNVIALNNLTDLLGNPNLVNKPDAWVCNANKDGIFYVKDSRVLIERKLLPSSQVGTSWFKFVPRKVNIFLWRFRLDRIPVSWNLSTKGIEVDSIVCPTCNDDIEMRDHLFFGCNVACDIWHKIPIWLGCGLPQMSSWDSFVVWLEGISLPVTSKN
ncbi:uncharacterized protein [Rutidosis leptorrhynchoides]|uniref:uncharacterized protein n=1 Tax=Rutidosis leptorrhynchoides TaxID=125765 RepID=UPI003A98F036